MERIKDIMSRYASFAWWVLMTFLLSSASLPEHCREASSEYVESSDAHSRQSSSDGSHGGEWLEAREGEK